MPLSSRASRRVLLDALERELRRATGQSVAFSNAVAERLGMHSTDLECLGFLFDEGPAPAGRLAELSGLTTGAVTRMIDRLERAGYVRREPDPRDRRRVIVRLIPERAHEVAALFEPMSRAMADLYAQYSDEQLALILHFAERAANVGQEQTARLRAASAANPASSVG
jgi:DNA-binding MarR family transcriptional regulator